jgi:CheY-like chemotaxis protein
MPEREIRILLVEDNPGDVRLAREAFRNFDIAIKLTVAPDGIDAIEILKNPQRQGAPPDLIILDLSLPHKIGPRSPRRDQSDACDQADSSADPVELIGGIPMRRKVTTCTRIRTS